MKKKSPCSNKNYKNVNLDEKRHKLVKKVRKM